MTNVVAKIEPAPSPQKKLLEKLAERYSVAPDVFKRTVSAVAMPQPHTEEELISCLIVANEHDLNPLTKEIHFMRSKTGQIQPIVGVDGWVKKLNTHPQFDGLKFDYEWAGAAPGKKLFAVTCTIYRKDRKYPIEVTEFMSECIRLPGPGKGPNAWVMTPTRMLRHRALIQGTRYAIGFGGVMDLDEYERWQEMKDITPRQAQAALSVPDDIPSDAEPPASIQAVSEAEASQDGPPINPEFYLQRLAEGLEEAASANAFDDVWQKHIDGDRLSREDVAKAEDLYNKHGKRFGREA